MSQVNRTPEPDPTLGAPLPGTAAPVTSSTTAAPEASPAPASTTSPSRSRSKSRDKADDPLRGSKASGAYVAVAALGIVLVLLIIFIAQNTQKTTVNFLGWSGQVSVAVALLIAAAAGLFLAIVASSVRILQLRRRVKRERKAG